MRPKLIERAPKLSFIRQKDGSPEPIRHKREICSSCGGKSSSYRRDDMVWRRCLSCDNTWCMGGSLALASATGEDRQDIIRELLKEPDYVQVSPEMKRSLVSWEQDQEIMNRNAEIYRFDRFTGED